MPKVKLYDVQGKVVGEKNLSAAVFGIKIDPAFVHEVVVSLQASARRPWAHTKMRGEVRGGGKKPWRQKGTGRARHGSIRSPLWAGGGVTFGPRSERDYTRKINRKTKQRALFMTLSDKLTGDKLIMVESMKAPAGKTKEVSGLLSKLPVAGKVLMLSEGKDEMLMRGVRNLPKARLVNTGSLSLLDVLDSDFLVMTPEAATRIEAAYSDKKRAKKG